MGNVALVVPNQCKKKEKYKWHPPLSNIRKHYLANDGSAISKVLFNRTEINSVYNKVSHINFAP